MNPYHSYPQQGYGYPAIIPPPNPFYAPPHNGHAVAQYHYRRPSDPGPHTRDITRPHKAYRKASDDDKRPRISQPTRPRNNSSRTDLAPDYIFVSLNSQGSLKIANLSSGEIIEILREQVRKLWSQGVTSQPSHLENEWSIKFQGGDVWSAAGSQGTLVCRIVCKIFMVLAEKGFGYMSTVDFGNMMKTPRMMFTSAPRDPDPRYFMISFSLDRRVITIIDAPEKLTKLLGAALRSSSSGSQSTSALGTSHRVTDGAYEVVINSQAGANRKALANFMGGPLKLIAAEGYRFEACVPLGKTGLFGVRGRREVWMFRKVFTSKRS